MIIREQNGVAGLLRELRNGIKAEIERSNKGHLRMHSESDEPSKKGETMTSSTHECIPLV